jgi:hypothetical protein
MSFIDAGNRLPYKSFAGIDTSGKKIAAPLLSYRKEIPYRHSFAELNYAIAYGKASTVLLGQTKQGRDIEAYYFPGTSDKRALVIGGVHGSELSAIEVSKTLIDLLSSGSRPYYSVIVIPSLFPDNAARAMMKPSLIGDPLNIGRYSNDNAVDPNRQMPGPGCAFDEQDPRDYVGRTIEVENQALLQLIDFFKPSRIANLHAIRHTNYGGVYADPRTDHRGFALGYESDSSLAIAVATSIDMNGGNVAGNHLHKEPTALYYKDPRPAAAGHKQKRNMTGSALNSHRGSGVSLGTWGTTAVHDDMDSTRNRTAMRVLTIEFPGAKRPADHKNVQQQRYWQQQVQHFALSVAEVFLGNYYPENI